MDTQFVFWMVYGLLRSTPTYQHTSEASAIAEAKRLAAATPGERFLVLRVVDAYELARPEPQQVKLDDIPF